jgi:hypothetical protein
VALNREESSVPACNQFTLAVDDATVSYNRRHSAGVVNRLLPLVAQILNTKSEIIDTKSVVVNILLFCVVRSLLRDLFFLVLPSPTTSLASFSNYCTGLFLSQILLRA